MKTELLIYMYAIYIYIYLYICNDFFKKNLTPVISQMEKYTHAIIVRYEYSMYHIDVEKNHGVMLLLYTQNQFSWRNKETYI